MNFMIINVLKERKIKWKSVFQFSGQSGGLQTKEFCAHTFSPKDSIQIISHSNKFTLRLKGKYLQFDHGNFLIGYVAYNDRQDGRLFF